MRGFAHCLECLHRAARRRQASFACLSVRMERWTQSLPFRGYLARGTACTMGTYTPWRYKSPRLWRPSRNSRTTKYHLGRCSRLIAHHHTPFHRHRRPTRAHLRRRKGNLTWYLYTSTFFDKSYTILFSDRVPAWFAYLGQQFHYFFTRTRSPRASGRQSPNCSYRSVLLFCPDGTLFDAYPNLPPAILTRSMVCYTHAEHLHAYAQVPESTVL